MIGKQLAHYEIESRLGAGGMGEVYLAEDTRLQRKVALKLLPTEQIGDAERLARFEQEARATSALNHPNITTIFETGDVEDIYYIAIEYIEGRTLRALFDSNTLELRKVLDLAVQISDGLAAAHEANVVHRDLKPENIMVRDDGIVKILDFGLAKLASRLMDDDAPVDEDETIVQKGTARSGSLTDPGMVLGTVSYMSPEQARGEAVDFRSDIFSFGSVLYEALARKRAFQHDSGVETMTAIIRETPAPLQELAPETPPELVRIIRKAMSKDANERYQSGKDLSLDLRALRREVESGSISAQWAATSVSTPRVAKARRRKWLAPVVVIAIFAAFLPIWNRASRQPSAAPPAVTKTRVTSSGTAIRGALSPTARILGFVQKQGDLSSLWIRQIGAGTNAQIIEPTEQSIGSLTFTPDGEWLLFTQREPNSTLRRLYRIPVVGGTAREVLEDVDSKASFAPDGNRFVFLRAVDRTDMMFLVATLDGSQPVEELYRKPADALGVGGPVWSPDGNEIAFFQIKPDGLFRPQITILNLQSGEVASLPHPEWVRIYGMQWKRDGSGLYATAQRQWQSKAHVFNVNRDGSGTQHITRGFDAYMYPSLSADGQAMAVTRNSFTTKIVSVPTTGTTQENTLAARDIVTGTGHNNDGSFSPDGKRIAYMTSNDEKLNIWTMKPDGTDRQQLTFDEEHVYQPYWSPDGNSIAFGASVDGNLQIWAMDASGRNSRQLTFDDSASYGHSWSPDSQWLSFIRLEGNTGYLYKVPVAGGEAQQIGSGEGSGLTAWSPDGEWILSWRGLGTRQGPELTLFAADGSDRTQSIDTTQLNLRLTGIYQLISLRWAPDSKTLYAVRRENASENIVRLSIADGSVEPITQFSNLDMVFTFSVSPDESQIAVTRGLITNDIVLLQNLSGPTP